MLVHHRYKSWRKTNPTDETLFAVLNTQIFTVASLLCLLSSWRLKLLNQSGFSSAANGTRSKQEAVGEMQPYLKLKLGGNQEEEAWKFYFSFFFSHLSCPVKDTFKIRFRKTVYPHPHSCLVVIFPLASSLDDTILMSCLCNNKIFVRLLK